ncbi:MAG: protein NosL [Rhodospirillaceae bacterium]|jgi:copper chaperone NosL|nr:protein NosL [Rhodospirillaceae bacterium]MBT4219206.1 protein NosL [Rhodospirillaceae bacterium]MBT4464126.1 protein NosL [Rhodospirillaceae bacterium]MBT5014539.1 protein NosL [Rhodospirillaceae bacterium]MBT5309267.1 protein NosL [Rhodospirillaceae bacterium]
MRTVLYIVAIAVLVAVGIWMSGLLKPAKGPENVHWDRDVCELCRMMVSDAGFAAEVRGGSKNKLYKFDDIGCAINWLNEQSWADAPETEIWIADDKSSRDQLIWLDARAVHYTTGKITPMNYGLGTSVTPEEGAMSFEQMVTSVLSGKPNHICETR